MRGVNDEGSPVLLLASGSPRRRELLAALGARFEVRPAEVDERPLEDEEPRAMAARLAAAKARTVARQRPDALVLAADTVVIVDGTVLGKPRDAEENRRFLRALGGIDHTVVTAHHLSREGQERTVSVATEVRLRRLGEEEIDRWVARGAGLDKAGGYAIQDLGAALVAELRGCYTNVVGMSLPAVIREAARLGAPLV
jgi:septum formation protein